MDIITQKIKDLKVESRNAQQKIEEIAQNAMKELLANVQNKTSDLQANRLELARQYKEMQYMSDFI